MSAARSARLATSRSCSSVLASWEPKIWMSAMVPPTISKYPAGMRGTASPRAHPGATSEVFVPVLFFFRFLVTLVVEAAVFAADVRGRLPQRPDQLRAQTHASARNVNELDPPPPRPAIQLPLDERRHLAADHPAASDHGGVQHEVLAVRLLFLLPFHVSSRLARRERSIPFESRGPSEISRPDRARNNSPHHVAGTGWGEREDRGIACLALCSRAE